MRTTVFAWKTIDSGALRLRLVMLTVVTLRKLGGLKSKGAWRNSSAGLKSKGV